MSNFPEQSVANRIVDPRVQFAVDQLAGFVNAPAYDPDLPDGINFKSCLRNGGFRLILEVYTGAVNFGPFGEGPLDEDLHIVFEARWSGLDDVDAKRLRSEVHGLAHQAFHEYHDFDGTDDDYPDFEDAHGWDEHREERNDWSCQFSFEAKV